MYRVVLSPAAIKDLEETKSYISVELKNPTAAKRVIADIFKQIHILETYPEAGPSIAAITVENTDIRILTCGRYIAMYRICGDTIRVARIINARQDYMRIILESNSNQTGG